MNISSIGQEITRRFFFALDEAIACKRIRGINTFTKAHDINRRNFLFVKQNMSTSVLKPEWINYLCNDLDISAEYIIFGKGKIFNDK